MQKFTRAFLLTCIFSFLLSTLWAGWNPLGKKHRRSGEENVQLLSEKVKRVDPEFEKFFANAVGWAVFPSIGKAGIGIGWF